MRKEVMKAQELAIMVLWKIKASQNPFMSLLQEVR